MTKSCLPVLFLTVFWLLLMISLQAGSFPVAFYDYHQTVNGYSPEVSSVGGLNLTNPQSSHTAFYNPALLAYRTKTTMSSTFRFFSERTTEYDHRQMPDENSMRWYRDNFSYFGFDSENIGFSYVALANLAIEREVHHEDHDERIHTDYYLDAYRFSFADKTGLLAMGFNVSLLAGRVVYLRESIIDEDSYTEQFIDSRGWGYNIDFGAIIKSGSISYGLTIPNLLSRVYWQDNPDHSLERRLHAGFQWGDGENYLVSGYSRKFDLSSQATYHLGLQQIIDFGMIRGGYHSMPLRLGLHTESFRSLKDIGFSAGTGYQYSVFQIDLAYMVDSIERNREVFLFSLSIGL